MNEINQARANPQNFISYLESYKKLFKDKTAYYPDGMMLTTSEGITVIDEAIAFLRTLPPLSPYQLSKVLSTAARSQLTDLMENSSLGHFGKDGKTLPQRLVKFGTFGNATSENITYYQIQPRDIVLAMIIDDGVKSRGHRKNVFNSNFKQIGISFGKGQKGENLCVAIFADSFREAGAIPMDKRLKPF